MLTTKPYNDYSGYMKRNFLTRVQKISLNAGFTCPNRDGSKAYGGCIYCDNKTFNPFYCQPEKSINQQLSEGIEFFAKKYKTQQYLAYFQAYTNTYATLEILKNKYNEALQHQNIIGLVIATRPDCVDNEIFDYIAQLSEKYYIVLELGVESFDNQTLKLINRCHTAEESINAINESTKRGIKTGIHIIFGLPTETNQSIVNQANIVSGLNIFTVKFHQLQIIKNTKLAAYFEQNKEQFITFTVDNYIDLCIDYLELLNPNIIIERFISESPVNMIISPRWNGIKNFEFVAKLEKRMAERGTWQGKLVVPTKQ